MGYSAKNAKQILDQKIQEERLRAEIERKRALQEKERADLLKKIQQQIDRKVNHLASEVIESALTDRVVKFALEKKVTADLGLRAELLKRGFELIRPAAIDDPFEEDYLPQTLEMLEALIEIEKIAPEMADQIEELAKVNQRDYRVLTLEQWRETKGVIDGKFSKKFNKESLSFEDYQALCRKFSEISELSIFEGSDDEFDDLDGVSPSEIIRDIVYDLFGVYRDEIKKDIGVLFLRWRSPARVIDGFQDDFFTAEKMKWVSSDEAEEFIEQVLDKIQKHASSGKQSIKLYLLDSGFNEREVSCDNKCFIRFPYSLNSLLDLFKRLGYQIKDKKLRSVDASIQGTVSIVWS